MNTETNGERDSMARVNAELEESAAKMLSMRKREFERGDRVQMIHGTRRDVGTVKVKVEQEPRYLVSVDARGDYPEHDRCFYTFELEPLASLDTDNSERDSPKLPVMQPRPVYGYTADQMRDYGVQCVRAALASRPAEPQAPHCTDSDCGCQIPFATEPMEALRFLSGRFKHAGVGEAVAMSYARDIDAILAAEPAVEPAVEPRAAGLTDELIDRGKTIEGLVATLTAIRDMPMVEQDNLLSANMRLSARGALLYFRRPVDVLATASPQPGAETEAVALDPTQVESRLRGWRQSFVNRSGDQLALDDFMDERSLEDLIDFVCSEFPHASESPPTPAVSQGLSDEARDAARYRWLRGQPVQTPELVLDVVRWDNYACNQIRGESLDAEIDAAELAAAGRPR